MKAWAMVEAAAGRGGGEDLRVSNNDSRAKEKDSKSSKEENESKVEAGLPSDKHQGSLKN